MGSLLKRFREPVFVLGLLAASFFAFFVRARKGPHLSRFDQLVISAIAPAEKLITLAAYAGIDAWQSYVALRGVREENLRLRRALVQAHAFDQQVAELKLENDRLRRLLDFTDRQAPMRLIAARAIGVGASPHSHTLRIARGSDDGLVRGAAVISPEGVVGTVAQLTAKYADVQLIVNPLSAVAAVSQRSRSRSTVKGTGDITRCRLEYALRTDDIQDGDTLVTAGGQGFFPPGLRIGRVVNVTRRQSGMFLSAEVVPAVDFVKLDEVAVVVEQRQSAPAVAGSTP